VSTRVVSKMSEEKPLLLNHNILAPLPILPQHHEKEREERGCTMFIFHTFSFNKKVEFHEQKDAAFDPSSLRSFMGNFKGKGKESGGVCSSEGL